jgi:hypothetical protein
MSEKDILEIVHIINLYGVAVDTQRFDLFDRIFTADVDAHYSESAHWRDIGTLKRDFTDYHDPFDGTQHSMSNHVVHVDGDSAQTITYAHWRLIRSGVPGGEFWEGNGWYDDQLVRTGAGWRIGKRRCHIIWWGGNPLVNQTTPGVHFELPVTSLRARNKAGEVPYMKAIGAG